MIALAAVPILISLALGIDGPRLAKSLSGRAATVLVTLVALICALATGLVMCAIGCLALAQWAPFALLGHWSPATLAANDPLPRTVDIGCAVIACAMVTASVARVVVSLHRLTSSVTLCRALAHAHPGDLVVLDDGEPEAYALAGLPGRTVVTRSMLRALSGAERRALLAHESSHVDNFHFVYVTLAQLAATANPLLAPLVPAVRLAVERWADEDAAAHVADRHVVATALARASLAGHARGRRPNGALAAAASDVRQRIDALTEPETGRGTSRLVCLALLAAAACCAVTSGAVGLQLHQLIEWAQTIAASRSK